MNSLQNGLVLGYGSVGRRHARLLAEVTTALAIVETNAANSEQARQDHPHAVVVNDLRLLDAVHLPPKRTLAVIATWGPSHSALFHALADRGIRHIVCEKPMAASSEDAQAMSDRARRENISLCVHHYLRYTEIVPGLRQLFEQHGLGEPVQVVVEAGAACLLTNGIHWLDFATEIFRSSPIDVISSASGEPLNPRSKDLMLYGGTAIWSFGQGREAVISFSNRSSIGLIARVYLRNAIADIDGNMEVTLRVRNPEAVAKFPAVTRTGAADQVLFTGRVPGSLEYLDGIRAAHRDAAAPDAQRCPGQIGAAAVEACIAALVSARERRAVDLPGKPDSAWLRESWPIS